MRVSGLSKSCTLARRASLRLPRRPLPAGEGSQTPKM